MAPRGADADNQGEPMTRTYDQWMRERDVWRVIEAASEDSKARDAAVARIIDTMLEVQLDYSHVSPGWPPISSTALACAAAKGEVMGGGYSDGDSMAAAYTRTWKGSPWHVACHYLMRKLPPRGVAAMLMQAARVRPRKAMVGNWWCKTNRQIFEQQDEALRRLQLKGKAILPFESERAWRWHATEARKVLREWLEAGEIKPVVQEGQKILDHAEEFGLMCQCTHGKEDNRHDHLHHTERTGRDIHGQDRGGAGGQRRSLSDRHAAQS